MKLINKILCFLSVFVFSLPFFCFNVSATEIEDLIDFDSILSTLPDFDTTDFSNYDAKYVCDTINSLTVPMDSSDINEICKSTDYYPIAYLNVGDYIIKSGVSKHCPQIIFLLSLAYSYSQKIISSDKPVYYYFYQFTYTDSNGYFTYGYNYLFSNEPFSFVEYDSTTLCLKYHNCFVNSYCFSYPVISAATPYGAGFEIGSDYFKRYLFDKSSFTKYLRYTTDYALIPDSYSFLSAFSNFEIGGLDLFESDIDKLNLGLSSLNSNSLSDNIDVKLTPEFGLDMDRIDPLTNQSDYFKFEIKNNSDSPVQWSAGIYDPQLITADTVYIDSISSWGYVSRTTYYDFSCQEEKGIFRTTYTYSGTLKTGSFNYHYLEPGETFTDVIYWENIKISPNVIYHFFVNAVKTDLNHATLNIDPPVMEESSDMHSVTKIEDSYYNTILNVGSAFRTLESNIYNVEFSCLSMPAFTTTVRSGNSVLNTSGTDRYKQYENYETVSDINGLDTKVNKDYVDPSILANLNNKSDVNVDFDNVGLDDVKNYISYSQDFFNLIKSVLGTFPAFVWVLICFGLTGLIVIAIIKALL